MAVEHGGEGCDCCRELGAGGGDEPDRAAYGLRSNQLYGWRREFRAAVAADTGVLGSDFVPIVADNRVGSNALTIEIGGAIVRVEPGVDPAFLSEVIRLLKAAA